MKEKIYLVSIGIRHRRYFRMSEIAGSIVDYIVQSPSSPFGKDFFQSSDTLLNGFESKGRILIGADNGSSIVVDTDSFILNLETDDLDKMLGRIKTDFLPFIKKIFREFKINNINRTGIVFEFKDFDVEKINDISKKITSDSFYKSDIFQLRLSEKDVDIMSLVKKEIYDYANQIISISKNEEGKVLGKFDYQFYYSPEINSIEDIDFNKLIDTASERLKSKFLNWLKYEK